MEHTFGPWIFFWAHYVVDENNGNESGSIYACRITPANTLLHIATCQGTLLKIEVCLYLSVLGVTPVTSQEDWSSVVNQLPSPSISITAAPEQRSRVKRTS